VSKEEAVTLQNSLKFNIEHRAAGWAIDAPGAWFAFHAKLAFTTWAGDFHLRDVRCEGKVMHAGGTFEMRWALVHTSDQHLTTFRAANLFFLPILSGDWVINSNLY